MSSSNSCDGSSSMTMAMFCIASRKRRGIDARASATNFSNRFLCNCAFLRRGAARARDDGREVVAIVADGAGYYVRLTARPRDDLDLGADGRLAAFELSVEDVLEDAVTYATLTSGITFQLHEREQVLQRWQRTLDALRG